MANGVYVAVSGSITQLQHLEVLANNLAQARTPGFKRDSVTFREVARDDPRRPDGAADLPDKDYAQSVGTHARLDEGPLVRTENPLDVALTGRGFLRVQTARGERLTRNGRLMRGQDGLLRTHTGHPVLNDEGRTIALPPDRVPVIDHEGTIMAGDFVVGRLGVLVARTEDRLVKDAEGLFVPPPESGVRDSGVAVLQGQLEESNVSPVTTMVDLIEVQRHFEALQQAISTYEEADRTATRLAG